MLIGIVRYGAGLGLGERRGVDAIMISSNGEVEVPRNRLTMLSAAATMLGIGVGGEFMLRSGESEASGDEGRQK
jgi:hypothetical protein